MKKPGQPIQVNVMDFLQPDRAETRPPEDILKWYSPCLSFVIVTGSRFETTMRRRSPVDVDAIVGEMRFGAVEGGGGWWWFEFERPAGHRCCIKSRNSCRHRICAEQPGARTKRAMVYHAQTLSSTTTTTPTSLRRRLTCREPLQLRTELRPVVATRPSLHSCCANMHCPTQRPSHVLAESALNSPCR